MEKRYRVLTWDHDKQKYTPQIGVESGPYTLFGLRKAIRKLESMGYVIRGESAVGVEIEEITWLRLAKGGE